MKTNSYSLIPKRKSWLSGLLDLHVSIILLIPPWCDIWPNIFVNDASSVSMVQINNMFIMTPLVSNGFLDLWVVIRSYKLLFLALSRLHESRIPLLKRCNTGLTRSAPQLLNTIFSRKISTTWMRAVFQSVPSRHRRLLSINIFRSVIKLNLVVKSGLHRSNVFVPMACMFLLSSFFEQKIHPQAGFPTIFPMIGDSVVTPKAGPAISMEKNGCINVLNQ